MSPATSSPVEVFPFSFSGRSLPEVPLSSTPIFCEHHTLVLTTGGQLADLFINVNLASVSGTFLSIPPYSTNQYHGDLEIWSHLQSTKWSFSTCRWNQSWLSSCGRPKSCLGPTRSETGS
ncbi:hypothetical protein DSO57_1036037 [Entomophthora muscae]|uniref:Uncharacterized protein n=1 Tax=Entomophthora muscae TaxID=34485 RepID=A0ACC2RQ92_9FUNG|nr:hypothetical protein DSO57_1036037 [Entomophthora muscae]